MLYTVQISKAIAEDQERSLVEQVQVPCSYKEIHECEITQLFCSLIRSCCLKFFQMHQLLFTKLQNMQFQFTVVNKLDVGVTSKKRLNSCQEHLNIKFFRTTLISSFECFGKHVVNNCSDKSGVLNVILSCQNPCFVIQQRSFCALLCLRF